MQILFYNIFGNGKSKDWRLLENFLNSTIFSARLGSFSTSLPERFDIFNKIF